MYLYISVHFCVSIVYMAMLVYTRLNAIRAPILMIGKTCNFIKCTVCIL